MKDKKLCEENIVQVAQNFAQLSMSAIYSALKVTKNMWPLSLAQTHLSREEIRDHLVSTQNFPKN